MKLSDFSMTVPVNFFWGAVCVIAFSAGLWVHKLIEPTLHEQGSVGALLATPVAKFYLTVSIPNDGTPTADDVTITAL